jgi:hypothetical protein
MGRPGGSRPIRVFLVDVIATKAVRQQYPNVEVVALTSFSEAERVHSAR